MTRDHLEFRRTKEEQVGGEKVKGHSRSKDKERSRKDRKT